MRVCPFCEKHINIKYEVCPRCGSDLRPGQEQRAIERNRRANKALLIVTVAVGLLLSSFAVMIDPQPAQPEAFTKVEPLPVEEIDLQELEAFSQDLRQFVVLNGRSYGYFSNYVGQLAPEPLFDAVSLEAPGSEVIDVQQMDTDDGLNLIVRVHLEKGNYTYGQVEDEARRVARAYQRDNVRKVIVQFWGDWRSVQRDEDPDYYFEWTDPSAAPTYYQTI